MSFHLIHTAWTVAEPVTAAEAWALAAELYAKVRACGPLTFAISHSHNNAGH